MGQYLSYSLYMKINIGLYSNYSVDGYRGNYVDHI